MIRKRNLLDVLIGEKPSDAQLAAYMSGKSKWLPERDAHGTFLTRRMVLGRTISKRRTA